MLGIRSASVIKALGVAIVCLGLLNGCTQPDTSEPPLDIRLYQAWQLQPGDTVAGYTVVGGLGDISIALNRNAIYAPFDGRVQRDPKTCVFFSTPDVPAYLFRLCGLKNPRLGSIRQGDAIGSGSTLQFATLRKQPNGTWAIVEPSKDILERMLKPNR
ncbi:hypothetical protein H6F43_16470 [Leptolyngbya sp. FACHB-36]|uniref:hypothetical protein n=1 Tax=Leptolyngbya sp. FACHB-36 TaxID=2692808 RepID=UPI001680C609|nr:hypothetical protein [Leptolyngbya sp. FACHB-36]MBD2021776.1 hypothetical protein [Leptolyngbya sp. FACHB-36]